MNKDIDSLRNEVIESFIAHELGYELKLTNSQYDAKLAELKELEPEFNPFDYLPTDGERVDHSIDFITLEKYSPENNNIQQYWTTEDGKIKTPKYDGSSLVIYYKEGKLTHILSMGDKNTGIVQTDKFINFVPKEINPNIKALRCECVVDIRTYGEAARGKANGLVNSKYLQAEVDKYVSLIVFEGYDLEGNLIDVTKLNIDSIKTDRYVFVVSPQVDRITYLRRGFCRLDDYDLEVCIDGIVYSVDDQWNTPWSYKYDYLESAITTVTDIIYNISPYEGYVPVLELDPVELDNKTMNRVSAGSYKMLVDKRLGVGAQVEVAFSKTTIPKVISVLKPVPVELGTCTCGRVFDKSDIVSGQLKCWNPECSTIYDFRKELMEGWLEGKTDIKSEILNDLESYFWGLMNISRFDWSNESYSEGLLKSILTFDVNIVSNYIYNNYSLTERVTWEIDRNLTATLNILKEYL